MPLSILRNVPTDILACFQHSGGWGVGLSVGFFFFFGGCCCCWDVLSFAAIANCINLLCHWSSAGVSSREGVTCIAGE